MLKASHEGAGQIAGVPGVRMYVADGTRYIAAADMRRIFLQDVTSMMFDDIFLSVRFESMKAKKGMIRVISVMEFLELIERIMTMGLPESERPLLVRCGKILSRLARIGVASANDELQMV